MIIEIESRFIGLPHSHTTLIKSLISKANLFTGVVEEVCYRELITLLTVRPAPGRKGAGSPSKESIRNYIKSIERECGDYFKVISEGQNLKFQFPELPKLFIKQFKEEVNTDSTDEKPVELTEEFGENRAETNTELNIKVNTADFAVKNNINITKHNKQTTPPATWGKKPIDDNFYPSQDTIQLALAQGLTNVENQAEIAKFIQYNLTNDCQWNDFNPVFITWLERERDYSQLKRNKQPSQGNARSRVNECSTYSKNSYESAMAAVMRANADACPPCRPTATQERYDDEPLSFEYLMAMAAAHSPVRPIVY